MIRPIISTLIKLLALKSSFRNHQSSVTWNVGGNCLRTHGRKFTLGASRNCAFYAKYCHFALVNMFVLIQPLSAVKFSCLIMLFLFPWLLNAPQRSERWRRVKSELLNCPEKEWNMIYDSLSLNRPAMFCIFDACFFVFRLGRVSAHCQQAAWFKDLAIVLYITGRLVQIHYPPW